MLHWMMFLANWFRVYYCLFIYFVLIHILYKKSNKKNNKKMKKKVVEAKGR